MGRSPVRALEVWRDALAGARGITFTGALVGGMGIFFTSSPYVLPPGTPDLDGFPLAWTLLSAVGAVAVVGAGRLARGRSQRRSTFWLTLATFIVAGVGRAAINRLGLSSVDFELGFPAVAALAAVSAVVWFSVPAVVLTGLDRVRSARVRLAAEGRRLDRTRTSGRGLVDELSRECAPDRAGGISSELHSFGVRAAELATDAFARGEPDVPAYHRLAARMREYSTTVVRVVSHHVADRINAEIRPDAGAVGDDAANGNLPGDRPGARESALVALVTVGSFAPVATAAFGLVAVLTATSGAVGLVHGLRAALITAAALFVCLTIAQWSVGRRAMTWSVTARSVMAAGVHVVTSGLVAVLVAVLFAPGLSGRSPGWWVLSGFVDTMMICVVGGAIGAAGRLGNLNIEIRAAVAALAWESARTRARLEELRDWVVHVLHGDVQSRLVASAAQLDLAVDAQLPLDPRAVSAGEVAMAVAAGLDSAADELEVPGGSRSSRESSIGVVRGLEAIAAEWDPVLVIETSGSPADVRVIDANGDSAEDVVRVVREAAGNAYRHGAASRLTVAIEVDQSWIHLRVDDDGVGPGSAFKRGLGLSGMVGSAGRVRLMPGSTRGCRLEVDIPSVDAGVMTPSE